MLKQNNSDDSPMMKEVISLINGGLVPDKNFDVLANWKNDEKRFSLLTKVARTAFKTPAVHLNGLSALVDPQ